MIVICTVVDAARNRRALQLDDVDGNESVELLTVLIEEPSGIDASHQRIVFTDPASGGAERLLLPHRSLHEQGVRGDRCELTIYHKDVYAPPRSASSGASQAPTDANALITQLFQGSRASTAASTAVSGGLLGAAPLPPPASADALITQLFQQGAATAAASPEMVLDPEDPEYQRKLYEAIQRQNLEENLVNAMEYTPEAFARVVMLYVPCTVNNVPLTAFVDSGAQMSIMSERMAERCGIMRLLDRRMQGVAKGVGTCKILGRVHMAMVKLGTLILPFSITVLERQDMDFLIGLDQLKRHQMMIDLKGNCLRIGEEAITFLSEGELPEHLRKESAGEEGENESEGDRKSSAEVVPPAAAAGRATPPSASHTAGVDEEAAGKVQRLVEMTNLPEEIVRQALAAAEGNEDAAANMLLESIE